jgi:hypothetical protein
VIGKFFYRTNIDGSFLQPSKESEQNTHALIRTHRTNKYHFQTLKGTILFKSHSIAWSKVRVRTPQQFECWSLVVASAMNLLGLARSCGEALYRPWERRRERVTPRQVRRGMATILQQVGTPAQIPKPRGKSPGRPKGWRPAQAPRFCVARKAKRVPKKSCQPA